MVKKPVGVRVYVVIVGINRSLSYTHSSIDRHIIEALNRSRFFNVEVLVSLIHPPGDRIDNPRSRELGKLEKKLPATWGDYPLLHLSMSELESTVHRHYESFLALGDVWSDGGKSLHNILIFLAALKTTYQHYLSRRSSGVVVFCRPDVSIGGALPIRRLVLGAAVLDAFCRPKVFLPNWGVSPGNLNDRFAIISGSLVRKYFLRGDLLDQVLFSRRPMHSESFLADVIGRDARANISTPMYRVRIGGRVSRKDEKVHHKRKLTTKFVLLARALQRKFAKGKIHTGTFGKNEA